MSLGEDRRLAGKFFFSVEQCEKMAALRPFRPSLVALIHSEDEGINDLSENQELLTQYNTPWILSNIAVRNVNLAMCLGWKKNPFFNIYRVKRRYLKRERFNTIARPGLKLYAALRRLPPISTPARGFPFFLCLCILLSVYIFLCLYIFSFSSMLTNSYCTRNKVIKGLI